MTPSTKYWCFFRDEDHNNDHFDYNDGCEGLKHDLLGFPHEHPSKSTAKPSVTELTASVLNHHRHHHPHHPKKKIKNTQKFLKVRSFTGQNKTKWAKEDFLENSYSKTVVYSF